MEKEICRLSKCLREAEAGMKAPDPLSVDLGLNMTSVTSWLGGLARH